MYLYEPIEGLPMASQSLDRLIVAVEASNPGEDVQIGVAIEGSPSVVYVGTDTKIGLLWQVPKTYVGLMKVQVLA